MGCTGCLKTLPLGCSNTLPPEIEELLKEVTKRGDEITEKFLIEAGKKQNEKEEILKERHEKVAEADKTNIEALNKLLLDYNKKENENEEEIIKNELEKLHCLYEMGLDLSDKLKKITLDQLKKRLRRPQNWLNVL